MKQSEFIERGFSKDEDGRVLDESGNEYRDENGSMHYVEPEPLTGEQKAKYVKSGGNLCPFCDGADITSFDSPETTDDGIVQNIECENCGNQWRDIYALVGVEDIEDETSEIRVGDTLRHDGEPCKIVDIDRTNREDVQVQVEFSDTGTLWVSEDDLTH